MCALCVVFFSANNFLVSVFFSPSVVMVEGRKTSRMGRVVAAENSSMKKEGASCTPIVQVGQRACARIGSCIARIRSWSHWERFCRRVVGLDVQGWQSWWLSCLAV